MAGIQDQSFNFKLMGVLACTSTRTWKDKIPRNTQVVKESAEESSVATSLRREESLSRNSASRKFTQSQSKGKRIKRCALLEFLNGELAEASTPACASGIGDLLKRRTDTAGSSSSLSSSRSTNATCGNQESLGHAPRREGYAC